MLTGSLLISCSLLFIVPLVLDAVLTRDQKRFVDSQEEVEDWTGVDIPAAAADDFRFESFEEFSHTLWLRFDVSDASVLDGYLTELGFEEELTASDNPFMGDLRDELPRWWQPADATQFAASEITIIDENEPTLTISVLVDQSRAGQETVYVRFYEDTQ